MLEIGLAIAQVVLTTIAAAAVGGSVLASRLTGHHTALRWAVQTAVGFLIVSYAVFFLALAGFAERIHLTVLWALLGLTAMLWLASKTWRQRTPKQLGGWSIAITAAAVAYGSWMVLCATLPPAAVDELIHHLAVPRKMLEAGGSVLFLDNIYAYFPPLGEMLFLFGLGVGGEMAARLFHTVFGILVALALFGFSRRYLSVPAACWSVAVFLSVPSVMVIFPWAYVDLMFTLYAFLALTSLLEFFESRAFRWVVLSGVMAGGALATKYTGLPLVLLLALVALVEHLSARRRVLPVAPFALASIAAAIAAPYVWRNWHLTGWPLFPFAFSSFQLRPGINWNPDRAAMFLAMLASYGSGATSVGPASLWDALAAPVLVFVNGRFNDPRWYDGVAGPVFLLTPLVFWGRNRRASIGMLAVFSLMFLLYWGLTIRQVRFLIPILPVLSFLLAAGLNEWRSRLAFAVVGICVGISVVTGVKRVLDEKPLSFWTGAESRDVYLGRRFGGYSIYQVVNQRLGPGDRVYLVNMRNFGYYLRPEWRADFVFEFYQLEKLLDSPANPRDLTRFFESRGITHLLIDERITYSELALLPDQRVTFQGFLKEHATTLERIDGRTLYRFDTLQELPTEQVSASALTCEGLRP